MARSVCQGVLSAQGALERPPDGCGSDIVQNLKEFLLRDVHSQPPDYAHEGTPIQFSVQRDDDDMFRCAIELLHLGMAALLGGFLVAEFSQGLNDTLSRDNRQFGHQLIDDNRYGNGRFRRERQIFGVFVFKI